MPRPTSRSVFPSWTRLAARRLLLKSIRVGLKTFMGFAELTLRSAAHLASRVKVRGWEHIEAERAAGRPVILVVPHTWAVDMIGRYFAIRGLTMCTMMKSPKDQVFDWYINRERAKGGKVYERSVGIKPAIKAIRSGASFFYLPDQDHGREASIFVPFFGHPKATLPALPKLVKLTGARAVPILACYDEEGCYRLEIEPPFDPYPGAGSGGRCLRHERHGGAAAAPASRAVHVVSQDFRDHGASARVGWVLRRGH